MNNSQSLEKNEIMQEEADEAASNQSEFDVSMESKSSKISLRTRKAMMCSRNICISEAVDSDLKIWHIDKDLENMSLDFPK